LFKEKKKRPRLPRSEDRSLARPSTTLATSISCTVSAGTLARSSLKRSRGRLKGCAPSLPRRRTSAPRPKSLRASSVVPSSGTRVTSYVWFQYFLSRTTEQAAALGDYFKPYLKILFANITPDSRADWESALLDCFVRIIFKKNIHFFFFPTEQSRLPTQQMAGGLYL